ncbi:hypothetical protein [Vibrio splendidus]|uniref:Uncharacterized protein n=1 Tax=Vibrio splendidus 12E03 TaxID=1191305 RepID=A0A1E5FXP4_VIBSP|nr:hypothetical protein [Vibrio splendidus]OEF95174.1 hypothetical protein A142_14485 [Vibrio splendidus 12E03]
MNKFDWFSKLGNVVGVSFPFTSNFIQLKAEIDSYHLEQRVKVLEDPISSIAPNVIELSKALYSDFKQCNDHFLDFSDNYKTYERTIHLLDGAGYINKAGIIIEFDNPIYILYMAGWSESDQILSELVGYVDSCESGVCIPLANLSTSFDVPDKLIIAIFEIYAEKGLGFYDNTIGHESYIGK